MRILATQGGLPRISWGAVIAGVILSLIVYVILSVLGAAIGATLLSPLAPKISMQHFGFGSGVWVILTTVLAVLVGSYFAGRCAPVLGWLHGLLSWAVMILIAAYGMSSVLLGNVVSVQADQGAMSDAVQSVARASWYSFAALLVGAIIAVVSGTAGFRHQPPYEEGGGPTGRDAVLDAPLRVTRTTDDLRA